jgi:hypothetical protein
MEERLPHKQKGFFEQEQRIGVHKNILCLIEAQKSEAITIPPFLTEALEKSTKERVTMIFILSRGN